VFSILHPDTRDSIKHIRESVNPINPGSDYKLFFVSL
jgi:hypothetical protein